MECEIQPLRHLSCCFLTGQILIAKTRVEKNETKNQCVGL